MARFEARFHLHGEVWIRRKYKRHGESRWATSVQPRDFPVCYSRGRRPTADELKQCLSVGTLHVGEPRNG